MCKILCIHEFSREWVYIHYHSISGMHDPKVLKTTGVEMGWRWNRRFLTDGCWQVFQTDQRKLARDFPGDPVIKNLHSNARDTGSIPGWGNKIPHATEQLSLWVTKGKPTCPGARGLQWLEKNPCAATKIPTHHNEDPCAELRLNAAK